MSLAITLIIGLAVLSVLILVHELGHFITAKVSGVRVEEFGVGFPPRLFSVKRGETRYSLNAIPFGGFNKLSGEEDPTVPRSLASKGFGTRILVLSAGSLMNLLLPLLLFSVAFMVPHEVVMGEVLVADVAPNSPAARAGIEPGDIVLKANGDQVFNTAWLQRYIQLNLGREVTLLIKHADSTLEEVHLVPRWRPPEGQGAIGVVIKMANPSLVTQYYPFWRAIPMGIRQCVETFILFKNGIISVIIGTASVVIAGPIGIVQVTGEVAQAGVRPLLELAAFISIALGIFNLFPLPAIDGGRIAFVLLEVVRRGKRVSPRTEGLVHTIGFILLVGVLLIITYQDILRIISGERLIP